MSGKPLDFLTKNLLPLWKGDLPLWAAYWKYGVLGSFLAFLAAGAVGIVLGLLLNAVFDIKGNKLPNVVILLLYASYGVVTIVGIWRSARKYQGLFLWRIFAMAATTLSAVFVLVLLIAAFEHAVK